MRKVYCSDLESSGLLHHLIEQGDEARLHNFAVMDVCTNEIKVYHWKDRAEIQSFLDSGIILVMHNGICYDKNALIHFGFNVDNVIFVDTLGLSWYLDLNRANHGLESYGLEANVPKPKIDDWENLTQKDYDNRVIEDVKIQEYTYRKLKKMFEELYGELSDESFCTHRVVKYLNFKMEQLEEQQNTKIRVDIPKAKELIVEFTKLIDEKTLQLASVMPKVPEYTKSKRPAKPFKKDGSLSATGLKWKQLTEKANVDFDFDGEIKTVKCYNDPNPQSPQQIKDWLFSLGWKPQTFKFDKNDDGSERRIPQVYIPQSGGMLCPSIEALAEDTEEVQALVGLGVVKHRRGSVQGFLDSLIFDQYIEAGAKGFTNTLRLKHRKPCVNMPSSRVAYGEEVRGCLIAREGKRFVCSDLSSMENIWKFNYQLPYDPKYVMSQQSEDYDPHLDIAVEGGILTQAQADFYKIKKGGFSEDNYNKTSDLISLLSTSEFEIESILKSVGKSRGKGKNTNYGCFPMDTEVLTSSGFKTFDSLRVGDTVYSYKNGKIVQDSIKYLHFYEDAEVVHFGDSKKTLRCTANHRWLVQSRLWDAINRRNTKELCDVKILELRDMNKSSQILTTAPYIGGDCEIKPCEAALVGWILSDGCFSQSVTIAQSLNKFTKEVEMCLSQCGVSYTSYQSLRDNENHVNIYTLKKKDVGDIFSKLSLSLTKDQDFTGFILGLSKESLDSFVDAFYLGDGGVKNTSSYTIKQNEGFVCDAISLALFLQGDGRVKVEGVEKCKTIRKHKSKHISCQNKVVQKVSHEDVFCITTENGSFVAKQSGEIFLTGNCQYGAGAATIARTAGVDLATAKKLVKAYKKLNWSINEISKDQIRKTVSHGMYQWNPYSKMWYYLKTEKDGFSTLVQGSGSFLLDVWLKCIDNIKVRDGVKDKLKLCMSMHDENLQEFQLLTDEYVRDIFQEALDTVNKSLKVKIPFGCDTQFGLKYSEIH